MHRIAERQMHHVTTRILRTILRSACFLILACSEASDYCREFDHGSVAKLEDDDDDMEAVAE